MIGKIINFAYNLLGKIPIVRNFIGPKEKKVSFEEQQKFHKVVQENEKKEFVNLESAYKRIILDGLESKLIKNQNIRILRDNLPDFEKSFDFFVLKTSNDQIIDIKEKNLLNKIEEYQQKLIENFKKKVSELNNKPLNSKSHEEYINLWRNFNIENKRLIIETEEEIIFKIAKIENANNLDLMHGLKVSREISKKLSENTLNIFAEEINNLPIGYEIENENQKTSLREFIKTVFNQEYQIFFLGSKFGLHSDEIINNIFANIKSNKDKKGRDLFENLLVINKFQDTIQGSILQERNKLDSVDYKIGMLKPEIIQETFEKMADLNFDIVNLKDKFIKKEEYDKKKIAIYSELNNIKDFIYNSGLIESYINKEILKLERNDVLKNFGINEIEFRKNINKIYEKINWLNRYLGELQKEEIAGVEFKRIPIINLFSQTPDEKIDQFKRIILETSILAGIEVILKDQGLFKDNQDFTKKKISSSGKTLSATENFESIPWLKNFYKQRLDYYQKIYKNENSSFKIGAVIKEISKIGKELHRTKFFSSSDFFARYGIIEEGNHLNNLIGFMTNIGRMSLNLDYVSHFLASIDPAENETADPNLISNLDSIINYLSKESKVYDKNGNEIYAPLKTEENIKKKYEQLASLIGSRDFLALNTPIIIDFLRKTFGKDTPEDQPIEKESFYSKNQVLSTWLYYILVKFLPEHSNDADSLKARIMVFDQLVDQNFQNKSRFTSELYRKITRKARGLNELDKPSNKGKGIIKSLCADLERHINWHIAGKKESKIDLEIILNSYRDVEQSLKNNPKVLSKITKIQKEIFGNNEPLIKSLEENLINLFDRNPLLIMNFVKKNETTNPEYKNKLSKDLLIRIEKNIHKLNSYGNTIRILDSDENKIKQMIRILEDITYLGFLLNTLGQETITLTSKLFKKDSNKAENLDLKISKIIDFLNSNLILEVDSRYTQEQEVFPNQFEIKNKLKSLVSKKYFGFRNYENSLSWQPSKNSNDQRILAA